LYNQLTIQQFNTYATDLASNPASALTLRSFGSLHLATVSGRYFAAMALMQLAGMYSPSHQAQSPSWEPSFTQSRFSLLSAQLAGALAGFFFLARDAASLAILGIACGIRHEQTSQAG
jgi:hypothetical protein